MKKMYVIFIGLALIISGSQCWGSEVFPSKQIELIIAYPPGGPTDLAARIVAEKMREYLGHPVITINNGGGQGSAAATQVANAKPDGYTLLATTAGMTTYTLYTPSLPYRHTQLRAIGSPASFTQVVSVHKDLPVRNLAELVDYAKKNPGTLSCAVIGKGRNYFAMEFLKIKNQLTDQHLQVIPYQGDRPALMALLGKHVQVSVNDFSGARPFIRSGEIRGLAVLSPKRDALSPEVPTSAEQGFPEMDTSSRYLDFAPVKTPDEIVKKLESAMGKALQDKEVEERLRKIEIVAGFMNARDTDEWVNSDYKKWGEIISLVEKSGRAP